MEIVWFVLIGICARWLAGQLTKGSGFGLQGDLVVGVIGALLGGFAFQLIGFHAYGLLAQLIVATVGSLIGPGTKAFSMTLGKSIAVAGASRVRFEIAFSNLFNIENLDVNPSSLNITSSAFSRVTGTQTVDQAGPRTIQFALRYNF